MPIDEEEIHARTHRQHAIPQHIGAFQFKLVGAFTLKQFAYFGGFGFLAWLAIASGLPVLIKWPIAASFVAIGISFAFIPVAGRPLEKVLAAFIKAIITPTQRVWIKKGGLPEFFRSDFGKPQVVAPITKTAATRAALKEYLAQFQPPPTQAELAEVAFISQLDFGVTLPAAVALAAKQVTKEEKPEVEILTGLSLEERQPQREAVVPLAGTVNFVVRPVITIPSPPSAGKKVKPERPVILPPIGEVKVRKLHSRPDLTGDLTLKIRGEKKFTVSPQLRLRLGLPPEPVVEVEEVQDMGETPKVSEFIKTKTISLSPVISPSQPNIISGIVKDANYHLLEGVVLLVKNEQGVPVRALKSNLLGQFSISTPLANGRYKIEAEKERHKFSIIEFEAKGAPIKPIEVIAKG